jgi:hypothetical protein
VWSGWGAADSVPVLVGRGPELDEEGFHPGKLDVVLVAGGRVAFVALGVLVGVILTDERQVLEGAEVERVLPAGGVGGRVHRGSKGDALDQPGFDVRVPELHLGVPYLLRDDPTSLLLGLSGTVSWVTIDRRPYGS